MSASLFVPLICIFTVFSSATSQFYDPYSQYGYQNYPGQSIGYTPYPYQSYVSNPYQRFQAPSYVNYESPNYPFYSYPYSNQQSYPYPYTYPQYSQPQTYYNPNQINNYPSSDPVEAEDPYANIKTDIIDVEPKNFEYYKKFFNLEDNLQPVQVIEDNSAKSPGQQTPQIQPQVTVKTESSSYNYSSVPQGVSINDVKSKTYSFKKTYTLDPTKNENAVINLNFVNGVQVTTTEAPQADSNREEEEENDREEVEEVEEDVASVVTEEEVVTTTESEDPVGLSAWFK